MSGEGWGEFLTEEDEELSLLRDLVDGDIEAVLRDTDRAEFSKPRRRKP